MKKKTLSVILLCLSCSVSAFADHTASTYGINEFDYEIHIKQAEAGDPEAMLIVGQCLETGTGIKKDVKEAWQWYGKVAAED